MLSIIPNDVINIVYKYIHYDTLNVLNEEYNNRVTLHKCESMNGMIIGTIHFNLYNSSLHVCKMFNYRNECGGKYKNILSIHRIVYDGSGVWSDSNKAGPFVIVQELPKNY